MALEALDALCINDYSGYELGKRDAHLVDNALTAIKEALAQPKQEQGEPVAYVNGDALDNMLDDRLAFIQLTKSGYRATPLYTTPPQRTWVGLTVEERNDLYEKCHDQNGLPKQGYPDGFDYERAIEAKLKQKNGYAEEKNT